MFRPRDRLSSQSRTLPPVKRRAGPVNLGQHPAQYGDFTAVEVCPEKDAPERAHHMRRILFIQKTDLVQCGIKVRKQRLHLFGFSKLDRATSPGRFSGLAKLVTKKQYRLGQIERAIFIGGRNGGMPAAEGELLGGQAVVLAAENDCRPALRSDLLPEASGHLRGRKDLLAIFTMAPGGADRQGAVRHG